jgi:hypothetical protein
VAVHAGKSPTIWSQFIGLLMSDPLQSGCPPTAMTAKWKAWVNDNELAATSVKTNNAYFFMVFSSID